MKECEEENDNCTSELKDCRKELAAANAKIDELLCRITELESAKCKCEADLAKILCDTSIFVDKIVDRSEALTVVIQAAEELNNDVRNEADLFVGSHTLGCTEGPDCGC